MTTEEKVSKITCIYNSIETKDRIINKLNNVDSDVALSLEGTISGKCFYSFSEKQKKSIVAKEIIKLKGEKGELEKELNQLIK